MTSAADTDGRRETRFIDIVANDDTRSAFRAWKRARTGSGLPRLLDFAPHELPPRLLPWTLLYHLRPDGELVYGLAGEEMIRLFRENPKGRRVLEYAAPEEREARLRVILQSIRSGVPVWYVGRLLFEGKSHVRVGRLSLPVATGDGDGMLLLYVALGPAPLPRPSPGMLVQFDERDVFWCDVAELDQPE
jgi:hypothetical protein